MNKIILLGTGVLCVLVFGFTSESNKGLELVQKMQKSITGYGHYKCEMAIELKSKNGKSFVRNTTTIVRERENEGEQTLSIFKTPNDVKGTKLLSHSYKKASDDQWLFLPALNKVKKIANENKSGPFLGSEIAFEDMEYQIITKYSFEYKRDTVINNQKLHVVRRVPLNKYSGYKYIDTYLTSDKYLPIINDYFDKKGELFKRDKTVFKSFDNKTYVSTHLEVVNLKTGKSTNVSWTDYDFKSEIDESMFIVNNLNRVNF